MGLPVARSSTVAGWLAARDVLYCMGCCWGYGSPPACSTAAKALQHLQVQACYHSDIVEVCKLTLPCPWCSQLLAHGWQQRPAAVLQSAACPLVQGPPALPLSVGGRE